MAIKLNRDIENGLIETPYRIPKLLTLKIWSNKIRNIQLSISRSSAYGVEIQ